MGMLRLATILLALMTVACQTTSPVASKASPAATQALSPAPTPTLSSTPAASLPVVPPAIHCRIPVYDPGPGTRDGFISFPDGRWVSAGTSGGYYFDYAVSRWLPVTRNAVAPDGRRYAFTEGWAVTPASAPRLHIVDAATGHDLKLIAMPEAQPFVVVDFTGDGVYLIVAYEGIAPGVWRADPGTGGVTKVSDGYYVPASPTWFSVLDPADPKPVLSAESGQPQPDRIDRRDASGRITTWFYRPGYAVAWAAFAGRAEILVETYRGTASQEFEFWLVTGPGQATRLAGGPMDPSTPYDPLVGGVYNAISDSFGIWVGGSDGLYLVNPTGAIVRAYGSPVFPANGCF